MRKAGSLTSGEAQKDGVGAVSAYLRVHQPAGDEGKGHRETGLRKSKSLPGCMEPELSSRPSKGQGHSLALE